MNSNNIPLVSVCCLAFNHEKYIRKTFEGIFSQKVNFEFEIIVHDDASTDNTRKIIDEFDIKYPGIIKKLYQKENQYSKGINPYHTYIRPQIRGKYVADCECDDYWTDDHKLQKQIDFLEHNLEFSICGHSFKTVDSNEKLLFYDGRKGRGDHIISIEDTILNHAMPQTASMVYRAELIHDEPEFFRKLKVGDYPLRVYMALKGKFYYLDSTMSCYRRHGGDSWTTSVNKNIKELEIHLNKVMIFLDELDKYTDYRYLDIIKERKSYCNFLLLLNKKKYKQLFNNSYFQSLKAKKKVYYILKLNFPKLLQNLEKVKNIISNA